MCLLPKWYLLKVQKRFCLDKCNYIHARREPNNVVSCLELIVHVQVHQSGSLTLHAKGNNSQTRQTGYLSHVMATKNQYVLCVSYFSSHELHKTSIYLKAFIFKQLFSWIIFADILCVIFGMTMYLYSLVDCYTILWSYLMPHSHIRYYQLTYQNCVISANW